MLLQTHVQKKPQNEVVAVVLLLVVPATVRTQMHELTSGLFHATSMLSRTFITPGGAQCTFIKNAVCDCYCCLPFRCPVSLQRELVQLGVPHVGKGRVTGVILR